MLLAGSDSEGAINLAAIDLGTNSFHLVVVRASRSGTFSVLDQVKEEVRLGSGAGSFNIIAPDAEERGLAAVGRLAAMAATRGAAVRAVATSAVREARNRDAFIRAVERETGVAVEVISGKEEARLIYMGVLQALPVYDKVRLRYDIAARLRVAYSALYPFCYPPGCAGGGRRRRQHRVCAGQGRHASLLHLPQAGSHPPGRALSWA